MIRIQHATTRRGFLRSLGLGVAGITAASCSSMRRSASSPRPFTFVQLCDPQLGMGGYTEDLRRFHQAVKQINALQPEFAVICGDLVHNANERSFNDFKGIRASLRIPSHCAPGNHDIGRDPVEQSLEYYRRVIGADHYSMEHKGCVFVIVNTQLWKTPLEGESQRHDAWFQQVLTEAGRRGSRIFIVGHHPLFLEHPEEAEGYMNLPLPKRKELLDLCARCNVAAFLGGHAHRLVVNNHRGIQLVNGETTSKNFDGRPFGFRLWHVTGSGTCRHEFIALDAS